MTSADYQHSDIPRAGWVDRYLPPFFRPYARLARLDRPIPVYLLLFPCWWSIALAAAPGGLPDIWLLFLFGLGSIVMRGAGCTFNDLVDRNYDRQVARTADRPIASGEIGIFGALVFLALQLMIGLLILLLLRPLAAGLGVASLLLVATYPFMKRITYWPQAFLGLTFNWGALMAYAAATGRIDPAPVALYGAGIAWTLVYDTIYAHQDKEDDALIGVRSTARLFGERSQSWIDAFYALALICMVAALIIATWKLWMALLLVPTGLHFYWQTRRLDVNDAQRCLTIFRANRDTGLLIAAATVAAGWL